MFASLTSSLFSYALSYQGAKTNSFGLQSSNQAEKLLENAFVCKVSSYIDIFILVDEMQITSHN